MDLHWSPSSGQDGEKMERRLGKDYILTWFVHVSFSDKRNSLCYSHCQKKRNKAKDVSVTSGTTFKDLGVWL